MNITPLKRRLDKLETSHVALSHHYIVRFIDRLPEPELQSLTSEGQRFTRDPGETEEALVDRVLAALIKDGGRLLFAE